MFYYNMNVTMFCEVLIMISKKDLLKKMNISYGQLYRWKREELIPENWFMKLSVSSGQETFFEEDLIISRISKILELKDKYSLEELKDILNGTSNLNLYKVDSLSNFNIFNKKILKENLKDRKEDIPLLVNHFIHMICTEQGWKNKHISAAAIEALQAHDWPGNIRELRNVVERLIILSGDTITTEDINLYVQT